MGLDWCVNDKTVEGKDVERARLGSVLQDLQQSEDAAYATWLEKEGYERPHHYPNPISDEWVKTSDATAFRRRMDMLAKEMERCVITSMQTLGAPQVGSDKVADDHVRAQWGEYDDLQEKYPTVEEYLEATKGKYIPHLVESDGIGAVTGMAVGSDSFRGKVLGYMEWLPEDVRDQAYSNMSPEELMTYGAELIALARRRLDEYPEQEVLGVWGEDEKREAETVAAAGRWCVFWGSNGHSMFAWY